MSLYCAICKVSCPSDYQMKQHLQGRKHALYLAGGGAGAGGAGSSASMKGICFQFQNTGKCSKGASCTYKHIGGGSNYNYGSSYDSHNEDMYCKYTDKTNQSISSPISRSGPPPPGYCFSWWRTGNCSKGIASCTYKHKLQRASYDSNLISPAQENVQTTTKRYRDDSQRANANISSAEFHICKTDDPDKNGIDIKSGSTSCDTTSTKNTGSEKTKEEKAELAKVKTEPKTSKPQSMRLAPIFCMPVKREQNSKLQPKESDTSTGTTSDGRKEETKPTLKTTSKFPAAYKNLFYRKRDVNLSIQNGLVVWEFAYNAMVITAIKKYIKGRAWNPNMGKKGCWTCPLESLPDAIELYEHMGRSASYTLKQRAKQIQDTYGGASCSASDVIKTRVDVDLDKLKNGGNGDFVNGAFELGSVAVTFLYDADIVQSLRMLAPTQRSYDPTSKAWTIDLLALPRLLANLLPLGYNAPKPLRTLASLVNDIDGLLYGGGDLLHVKGTMNDEDEMKWGNDTVNVKDEKIEPSISPPTYEEEDIIIIDDSDDENDVTIVSEVESGGETFLEPEAEEKIEDQANAFETKMEAIVHLVAENSNGHQAKNPLDITSCDTSKAKRRKISCTPKVWTLEQEKYYDSGDDSYITGQNDHFDSFDQYSDDQDALSSTDDESNFCSSNTFTAFARNRLSNLMNMNPPDYDCDCGRPHIKVGGIHTCRYFGTFECALCDNRWTSAYCWKGEMQACRSCNHENYPVRKDKLDGSKSRGGLGAHDSENCGRCRKLGYSCTGYF